MSHFANRRFSLLEPGRAVAAILLFTSVAMACPTCKESIAHDPNSANLARGYYYSILFMLSAPYVIFGSLAAYFYWQIRKARANPSWPEAPEQSPSLPLS